MFAGFAYGQGYYAGGPLGLGIRLGEPTHGLKLRDLSNSTPELTALRQRQPALTVRARAPRVTDLSGD